MRGWGFTPPLGEDKIRLKDILQAIVQDAPAVEHRQWQQMQENMFGVSFEKNFCHSHGQIYENTMHNFLTNFWRTAVEFRTAFLKESELLFAASTLTAPIHKSEEITEQTVSHARFCLSTKCFPTH